MSQSIIPHREVDHLPSSEEIRQSRLQHAEVLLRSGLSILPVGTNKAPTVRQWKPLQDRQATMAEIESWLSNPLTLGYGIICGSISGNLEIIDVDETQIKEEYLTLLAQKEPDLFRSLLIVETPRGGCHVYYRCEVIEGNLKLAMKDGKALIETRGEGGYVVAPGSSPDVHPLRKSYTIIQGDLTCVTIITATQRCILRNMARSFDTGGPEKAHKEHGRSRGQTTRPGDDFNSRASWEQVLCPHDWSIFCQRGETTLWTRSGKGEGCSASTNFAGSNLLYVWSSSTVFQTERGYDKFGAYALLNHGGDIRKAAGDLASKGYGELLPETTWSTSKGGPLPVLIDLSTVQPQKVEWLWRNVIPAGKVTVFSGDPGLGKSFVTIDVAARISSGRSFHNDPSRKEGKVIIISAEDDLADTVVPRLMAAGANLKHILALKSILLQDDPAARRRFLDLSTDLDVIEQALVQTPGVRLVIIDPVSAYLGNTDTHKNSEVRAVMAPIEEMAGKHRVAILCIHHLNKGSGNAIGRVGGSIGFVAAARTAWTFAKDKEDPQRRLMVPTKSNLTGDTGGMAFRIVPVETDLARLEWEAGSVNITADEALNDDTSVAQVMQMLLEILADGPVEQQMVGKAVKTAGFTEYALRTAKSRLRIAARKEGIGVGSRWMWQLPELATGSTVMQAHNEEETVIQAHNKELPVHHTPSTPLDNDSDLWESDEEINTFKDVETSQRCRAFCGLHNPIVTDCGPNHNGVSIEFACQKPEEM